MGESGVIKSGNLSSSFGEFRTKREKGEVSGRLGPLHYYGAGSYSESGGFRPNSDVLEHRGFLKGEIPVSDLLAFQGSFGYSGSKVSEFDYPDLGVSGKRKVFSRYGKFT